MPPKRTNKNLPITSKLQGRRVTIEGIRYLFLAPGVSGLHPSKKGGRAKEYQPEHILPGRKKLLIDLKKSTISTYEKTY